MNVENVKEHDVLPRQQSRAVDERTSKYTNQNLHQHQGSILSNAFKAATAEYKGVSGPTEHQTSGPAN